MIRIKPEQDDTKRKAGVFRVYNLFQSSVSYKVCVCACIVDVLVSPIYFVVALHFGLFYLTNYKRAVFLVSQMYSPVCVCVCVWSFFIVWSVPLHFCPSKQTIILIIY